MIGSVEKFPSRLEGFCFFVPCASDAKGNKIEPAQLGIEHEAIDGAHDVVIFEDFGNGQTKLTFIGNETMENAKNSGQV